METSAMPSQSMTVVRFVLRGLSNASMPLCGNKKAFRKKGAEQQSIDLTRTITKYAIV
jgi:hypothetical protein